MEPTIETAVIAASTRRASLNGALARQIADHLSASGHPVDLIDLTDYEMPLYHGDLETDQGIPAATIALAARLATSSRLVITSPEYNGSFPALLKNTIDWLTRADRSVLSHLDIHLAAASPGRLGGSRGLVHLQSWLENMRLDVASPTLSVPHASVDDAGRLVTADPVDLDSFLAAPSGAVENGRRQPVRQPVRQ